MTMPSILGERQHMKGNIRLILLCTCNDLIRWKIPWLANSFGLDLGIIQPFENSKSNSNDSLLLTCERCFDMQSYFTLTYNTQL